MWTLLPLEVLTWSIVKAVTVSVNCRAIHIDLLQLLPFMGLHSLTRRTVTDAASSLPDK